MKVIPVIMTALIMLPVSAVGTVVLSADTQTGKPAPEQAASDVIARVGDQTIACTYFIRTTPTLLTPLQAI